MVYKEDLERIRRELCERKADLTEELKGLPDGEIMCVDQDGLRKYLQRIPAMGNRKKERRYGIKGKPDVLGTQGVYNKGYKGPG